MDKKAELELKKAKLEQIRKKKAAGSFQNESPNTSQNQASMESVDPEKILIECGITTPVLMSNVASTSSLSASEDLGSFQHLSLPGTQTKAMYRRQKAAKLEMNLVSTIDIAPRENVTYSKETQTPQTDVVLDKDAKPVDYYVLTYDDEEEGDNMDGESLAGSSSTHTGTSTQTQTHLSKQDKQKMDALKKIEKELSDNIKNIDDGVKSLNLKELSEEERGRVVESDEFLNFFMRNSKILEKALEQDDIFFEYGAIDKNNEHVETGEAYNLKREFYDEKLRNRIVTWLDWSPHYPELLLASYEDSSLDPDGIAVVWNAKFKTTTPEFIFNCSSWVTSCCFAKFHPNLVIGGTYSGQIVMWDNRSNKRTPIQRSSLSASSHTHPIYCVQVVGSQNAHNLISISNDGKLCSWTLDNMNTPQETIELQGKQSKQIAVTSMGFRHGDVNNFVIGSEEGTIYTATRHGNKSGINDSYEGHYGPITGLSCHQAQGPIDYSNYFLTSSFDWTVKLWNLKESSKPLYSFEHNSDYVYDVQWSPVHPAVFACADSTGRLDLWNLINDTEVPSASIVIDGVPALNKIRWSQSGHQIAIGDDQGRINLFDLNEAYVSPRQDDWNKLCKVLKDLRENSTQAEEVNTNVNNSGNPTGANVSTNPANFMQAPNMLPTVKSESNLEFRQSGSGISGFTTPILMNQGKAGIVQQSK